MSTKNSCNYTTGGVGTLLAGNGVGITPTFQAASGFSTTLTSTDTSVHLSHVGNNYDLSSISPTSFIVGETLGEECNYTSIQSAINDCAAAGGGTVLIRQKTTAYTENLTFLPNVNLSGFSTDARVTSNPSFVIISGHHTFSAISGTPVVTFENIYFIIFGSTTLFTFSVSNAVVAQLAFKFCKLDAISAGSTAIDASAIGTGQATSILFYTDAIADVNLLTTSGDGTKVLVALETSITSNGNSISTNGTGTTVIQIQTNSNADSGDTLILCNDTTNNITLQNSNLRSNNETINFSLGTGIATVTGCSITSRTPSGYWIAGTGTLEWADDVFLDTATALDPSISFDKLNWQPYAEAGSLGTTPAGTSSFDSTTFTVTDGFVQLTGSPGIQWFDIVVIVPGAVHMAANSGYLADHSGSLTFLLPATCPQFATIAVVGGNSTDWHIIQNAGQNIQFGNQSTTVGAGGSLSSTDQHDVVYLLCTVADTTFTVTQVIGNLTVV